MKLCKYCGETKNIFLFKKCNKTKSGHSNMCLDCKKNESKEYREKNKEKIKKYYQDTKKKHNENTKRYYKLNKEKIAAKSKKYREKNKEKIKKRNKKYQELNKEKIAAKSKEYREKNKEKLKQKRQQNKVRRRLVKRNYERKRSKTDSLYAFKNSIRKKIHFSIKRGGYIKKDCTEKIIGCTFEELEKHLTKTFEDKYGIKIDQAKEVLHIDHIIPLSTAKTEEEVIKLNHYTNLQYLYESHNLQKSNKLDWKLEDVI